MKSSVQVITTPTADTPGTSLLLQFPNKRYIIGNLSEGTQRAAVQAGARFLKVQEFFVTGRTEWHNIGGLVGVILTLADSLAASQASAVDDALKKMRAKAEREGYAEDEERMRQLEEQTKKEHRSKVTFLGPPNLNHTLATTRRFIFRRGMPVDIYEIRDGTAVTPNTDPENPWLPTWSDENIKVWAMSIAPEPFRNHAEPSPEPPTPANFRKRSSEEAFGTDALLQKEEVKNSDISEQDDLSQADRDYLTVKAVVQEMFDSSWRLDTLFETPLSQVKLPATIFVRDPESHKIRHYLGPLPDGKQVLPDPNLKVLVRRPWPGALVDSLPKTSPAEAAISYIIRNHPQRGKFNVQRARQLKVKPGPDFSKLTSGQNVVNADGETITPDMVLGDTKEGGGMAVVELPDTKYIAPLLARPEWQEPKVMSGVGAIFWICGKGVAMDTRLQGFMARHKHLEHIVSSPDYCPNNIALESTASSTVRLRKLDPDRYGIPVHDSAIAGHSYGGEGLSRMVKKNHPLPSNVHIAARGHYLDLEPQLKYRTESPHIVTPFDVAKEEASIPADALEEAANAREAISKEDASMKAWLDTLPPGAKDAEIITLGTGSALPSKYRNVSSTLVRVPGWGNILLDCGENTLGQLRRVFTAKQLEDVWQNLKLLTISHMHADHHLGLTGVVKAWYQHVHQGLPRPTLSPAENKPDVDMEALFRDQNRLAIIAEPAMQAWLYEYSAVEDFGYSAIAPLVLPCSLLRGKEHQAPGPLQWYTVPSVYNSLGSAEARAAHSTPRAVPKSLIGLEDIQAVQVSHCHGARAISITLPSGFKVSFSGDCRPSKQFAQIGRGSTVCIHEATFDDELQGDAIAKKHSTTSEALGVAEGMRARACVLTHFSQRYQKVPILERVEEDAAATAPQTSAEDGSDAIVVDEPNTDNVDMTDDAPDAGDQGGDPSEDVTYADQGPSETPGQQYDISRDEPNGNAGGVAKLRREASGPGEAVKLKLKSDMKVCVAFDYMRVKVGDIGHMEKFTPALLKLFAEEEKDGQGAEEGLSDAEEATMGDNGGKGKKQKKNKKGGAQGNQRRN